MRGGYAVCTVGRSGSNWLAQVLASTDELGNPIEYFNAVARRRTDPDYPEDARAQVAKILTAGCSPNGVYGVKVFAAQLAVVASQIKWTEHLPNLKLVRWKRRDLLGQALSRQRATQTWKWRSSSPEKAPAKYEGKAILESLAWIAAQNARWDMFFARNGPPAFTLYYEDAICDPQGTADRFSDMMEVGSRPRVVLSKVDV